jgi:hypothetical protein
VEACLFGSMDNMASYAGAHDRTTEGWYSSASNAVAQLVASRGSLNDSQWDDPEEIAVEAMRIATDQGKTRETEDGKPWTRGFTLSQADESEWFAEIYSDVELDKERWNIKGVDRILIGAPLWIRTPSVHSITRFREVRAGKVPPPL